MKKAKLLSIRFEPLSEESENLLGGFSASLGASAFSDDGSASNNCRGGNCAAGCGSGQDVNVATRCGANAYDCGH